MAGRVSEWWQAEARACQAEVRKSEPTRPESQQWAPPQASEAAGWKSGRGQEEARVRVRRRVRPSLLLPKAQGRGIVPERG